MRRTTVAVLGAIVCLFTLAEVNYPRLGPQAGLAIFAALGLMLCFLSYPWRSGPPSGGRGAAWLDGLLILSTVLSCGWVVIQTEPLFSHWWVGGQSLGNRAGQETWLDVAIGLAGLLLVLEATRRSIGLALPILALAFVGYAVFGPAMPDWLFPHRGYGLERIVAQTFLHSQGVFGVALSVMFTYVVLFVVFGALLQQTGATEFVIDLAQRLFGRTPGGPAKVAVVASGMMGSVSGSAVANTATTGIFTIPLMRNAGFRPEIAAGIEAAASSGGALAPPVMGAGAYMMLEIVRPPVTYLEVIRAALLPALLYYLSLFLLVHFIAKRIGSSLTAAAEPPRPARATWRFEGLVFAAGLGSLLALLLAGYTVFRAVSVALVVVPALAACVPRTRIGPRKLIDALLQAGRDLVPLVAAAACVGILLGVVTLTGIGTKLPSTILGLAEGQLVAALVLLMVSSLVLGMGLPSAVCYLLLATLVGPVLGDLGVEPLAAHMFIFYFGMMSMVTPPVALAAYVAASIAGAGIMRSSWAAFRMALVGFLLPYMFVFQPELLLLGAGGEPALPSDVAGALTLAVLGIVPYAAAIAGYLFDSLRWSERGLLFTAALLLLLPGSGLTAGAVTDIAVNGAALTLFAAVAGASWLRSRVRGGRAAA